MGAGPCSSGPALAGPDHDVAVTDSDPDYPFRSGPSFLAGLVVFVVVNVFVYAVTGKIGRALAIGFALWLVAALITRLVARGRDN